MGSPRRPARPSLASRRRRFLNQQVLDLLGDRFAVRPSARIPAGSRLPRFEVLVHIHHCSDTVLHFASSGILLVTLPDRCLPFWSFREINTQMDRSSRLGQPGGKSKFAYPHTLHLLQPLDGCFLGSFQTPTAVNDKVYVGTQTEIDVYGLCPAQRRRAWPRLLWVELRPTRAAWGDGKGYSTPTDLAIKKLPCVVVSKRWNLGGLLFSRCSAPPTHFSEE